MRGFGFMLLIAVLVLQFVAPSLSAALQPLEAVQQDMVQQDMVDHSAHDMMQHAATGEIDDDLSNSDCPHEGLLRCMPSMCCFHETSTPFALVALGLLLPSALVFDQGTLSTSHIHATKDRPPQHI